MRDLLGDTTKPANDFPSDDSVHGFTTVAEVLTMAPLLVEKFSTSAELLAKAVVEREAPNGRPVAAAKVVSCDVAQQGVICVRSLVAQFGRRAWRRPLTAAEVERYTSIYSGVVADGLTPTKALGFTIQGLLFSPHFLFRVELDPDPRSITPHPLTEHELAARLSYFLWASCPDAALDAVADRGAVTAELSGQVTRMLADPKAQTIVSQFGTQWLGLDIVETKQFSETLFPSFTPTVRRSMREQAEAFLGHFLNSPESVLSLMSSDFTYVNDTLASFYGLPSPGSASMRRVQLASQAERGGILGMGAVLALTSMPDRTSPVKRGAWVMETLLCAAPPAPPPGVEALPTAAGPNETLRQTVERHRADPTCAGCHAMMDPLGFGLEAFDAIGRKRTQDAQGNAIDSAGELPDGRRFNGPGEMGLLLKNDAQFSHCLTEKLFTYGVGRVPTRQETCRIDSITKRFAASGWTLKGLIQAIVENRSFTHRRGESQ